MISLDIDPAFADFNFSELWDPALRGGPTSASLYTLIYHARQGDRSAIVEFADTMHWTLRPETWECFQRLHGPRPISHRDWFYAKVTQFCDVLTYDQLTILEADGQPRKLQPDELVTEEFTITGGAVPLTQPDDLEQALVAERYSGYPWDGLVQRVLDNPTNRAGALQAWLTEQRMVQPRDQAERHRSGWDKNQERDRVIQNCLDRGMAPVSICDELDQRTISTLPSMKAKGVHRWRDGWDGVGTRNAIQQLFSKVRRRRKPVNPRTISK
jgi:hypothetical protein